MRALVLARLLPPLVPMQSNLGFGAPHPTARLCHSGQTGEKRRLREGLVTRREKPVPAAAVHRPGGTIYPTGGTRLDCAWAGAPRAAAAARPEDRGWNATYSNIACGTAGTTRS